MRKIILGLVIILVVVFGGYAFASSGLLSDSTDNTSNNSIDNTINDSIDANSTTPQSILVNTEKAIHKQFMEYNSVNGITVFYDPYDDSIMTVEGGYPSSGGNLYDDSSANEPIANENPQSYNYTDYPISEVYIGDIGIVQQE